MITLNAEIRDKKTNLETIRKNGFIPAVYYGKKEESTPVTISQVDFSRVFKEAGESNVVILKTPNEELETLIHAVDFDPLTGIPRHADFYVFEKGHKVEVEVPLEFTGISPAVKDLGGVLVKVLHVLKIEALPKDLPHVISVDISPLVAFESRIMSKDIKLPAGVICLEHEEEVVALVAPPKAEKVEETPEVDLSDIEVEKKGKEKEGEENGEETKEGETKSE